MAMNIGNASGDGEVMVEMNTTPLIDVMLVLLTLLIITLPIQTHAVKLDMPAGRKSAAAAGGAGGTGRGLRRHHHLERHAGRSRHDGHLFRSDAQQKPQQPEIHLNPNRLAKYDTVAMVLADAQRLGITNIGFTNTSQYGQ